ncbi:MAG TPA: Beta-galactosidase C-terminal domain, partial [Terriglobales bacterium]|nr:Beta-galactosidase C-terminal domain [Terriglobales bacterium]
HDIAPLLTAPQGVEVTARYKVGQSILFVLNHNPHPVTVSLDGQDFHDLLADGTVSGELALDAYGVSILTQKEVS